MIKTIRTAAPVIALAIMSIAPAFVHAQSTQKQNTPEVADWNSPPAGTEQAQLGYKDGVLALQLDLAAKRKIDAQTSHLYLHPPVKGAARDEYRANFVNGYQAALKHTSSGGGE